MTTPLFPPRGRRRLALVVLLAAALAGCVQTRTPRPVRSGGARTADGPASSGQGPSASAPSPQVLSASVTHGAAPDARPVVLTGDALERLLGAAPGDVVAFAYEGGRFRQVPVQVDERFAYDVATVYADLSLSECAGERQGGGWCRDLEGHVVVLGYADPDTHVGPDPDADLDGDDEVALMYADFGEEAVGHPDGVDAATGVEVAAAAGGTTRYAYLYRRTDGALDPAAGANYVAYDAVFERGPYLQTYDRVGRRLTGAGVPLIREPEASNPENTTVETGFYAAAFSERWILDELRIEGGPDLLDADMFAMAPGNCRRTPYTGSETEGGFLVNRDGPVRAIRRVAGFVSGPLMEEEWVFYQRYAQSRWNLRVHSLPSASWWIDHSAEAAGMRYRDENLEEWVAVDGQPDRTSQRSAAWRMLTGSQGSYVVAFDVASSGLDLPPAEHLYFDDTRPDIPTCLFDGAFYGAHGVWLSGRLPSTDPRRSRRAAEVALHRRFVFGGDPEEGLRELQEALRVTTQPARGGT